MLDEKEGCFEFSDGLVGLREKYPIVQIGSEDKPALAMIPFSSDIKFNLIIRNMNKEEADPKNIDDNMYVYLKGAPERVINRCSTLLVRDHKEIPLSENVLEQIKNANKRFGGMGERVLAFARTKLDQNKFKKNYQFDVIGWKKWANDSVPGWFPMTNLTLMGVVSLNDPPRPSVDISVLKCRNAGIKVIMVTGDQPPTAAAIAHKVNIITDPTLEYNYLLENSKMSEQEAFEKCQAIVIHGDELARVHAAE